MTSTLNSKYKAGRESIKYLSRIFQIFKQILMDWPSPGRPIVDHISLGLTFYRQNVGLPICARRLFLGSKNRRPNEFDISDRSSQGASKLPCITSFREVHGTTHTTHTTESSRQYTDGVGARECTDGRDHLLLINFSSLTQKTSCTEHAQTDREFGRDLSHFFPRL